MDCCNIFGERIPLKNTIRFNFRLIDTLKPSILLHFLLYEVTGLTRENEYVQFCKYLCGYIWIF